MSLKEMMTVRPGLPSSPDDGELASRTVSESPEDQERRLAWQQARLRPHPETPPGPSRVGSGAAGAEAPGVPPILHWHNAGGGSGVDAALEPSTLVLAPTPSSYVSPGDNAADFVTERSARERELNVPVFAPPLLPYLSELLAEAPVANYETCAPAIAVIDYTFDLPPLLLPT
ncbi:hypothetical protein BDY19DRAFT_910550 [Irpex rosettiformis]|uniref:Uncharacterized protein n=1 Tax=Irpex rosettiformis TaxID=378272 RepID=A0ACB8TNA1_9APHY|nr:hypothetical protein BDY19DRAFT_910550 [Irpex rosettiformis]